MHKTECHYVVCRVASAPAIYDCPSLVGPTVINRTQIEFYCDVNTNLTDPTVRFKVSFLFNFEVDADVPVQIVSSSNPRATLHERHLAGRLNKAVRDWISTNREHLYLIRLCLCNLLQQNNSTKKSFRLAPGFTRVLCESWRHLVAGRDTNILQ